MTNMKRTYTSDARAEGAAATRARILQTATDLLRERLRTDIRLEDVAVGAGVSEMTVLRAFGSKQKLLDAALAQAREQIVGQRQEPAPGDVAGSIAALFAHYEQLGDLVVNNLAEEASDPEVAKVVRLGRADHKAWVQRQFGPQLARRPAAERALLVDALVVACDVYVWKRLRRDMRRSRPQAIRTVQRLVEGVLDARPAEHV
jgi:AcrR family transcriptional regulator